MFGLKKNNVKSAQDETLVDHSKKIAIGTFALIFVVLIVIILEIFTISIKGAQVKKIAVGENAEKKSQNILIQMAKIGKDTKEIEYAFIKSLRTIMSPMEFQSFKNSISGLANKNNVFIASLNEGKPFKVSDYMVHSINFEAVAGYDDYVNFKKDISNTTFRINFDKEIIVRETPTSLSIKVNGIIHAVVYETKDKLFEEKKKFIQTMQLAEEKKIAREKRLRERKQKQSK